MMYLSGLIDQFTLGSGLSAVYIWVCKSRIYINQNNSIRDLLFIWHMFKSKLINVLIIQRIKYNYSRLIW